ncbi:GNAT family N-acetyltransferase [Ectobacillus sp. JY-23]|uniref:GNAT family N-acetyltransferase n=1 Tax=Ectobacillus sp. JY-23 TaxID=2933872 RepID=UPI001FF10EC6|nr:GNAT family N-acetyltransferase [Ectobacillus sp. JY-23]UOY93085.1 GNAT family N-acetyltransferase [Ectobacillus sp. JY-23]
MQLHIQQATLSQKEVIAHLLQLYKYDFTEFDPEDVNEQGLYEYTYFHNYWTDDDRFPFLFTVDGMYAGFALVRKLEHDTYSIAEFFVMKKYRQYGIGRQVAFQLFDSFSGTWEVAQMKENIPAQLFWRNVIGTYTKGSYQEITKEDWDGPIQRFQTSYR